MEYHFISCVVVLVFGNVLHGWGAVPVCLSLPNKVVFVCFSAMVWRKNYTFVV